MPRYAGIYLGVYVSLAVGSLHALGDAEPLGVAPAHFPKLLCRTPDGAEALGALAQFGFVPCDAHGDDLVVAAAQPGGTRAPGDRLDDELDGLEPPAVGLVAQVAHAHEPLTVALEEFLGSALARAQRESRFHEHETLR